MTARTAYTRIDGSGTAVVTTYTSLSGTGGTTLTLASATGWPDGSNGHFMAIIDEGLTTEEKLDCTSRSTTTLMIGARGADGTSAATHTTGSIRLIWPWEYANESNKAVYELLSKATAAGQVPVVSAAGVYTMLQAKTNAQILIGNGTTLVSVAVSGDITIDNAGVVTIGAGKLTAAMHNSTDFTAAGLALMDDANASAQRTTLGLAIGTNVQAYDAELAALAGLTSTADKLPYFTGSGTAALSTFTSAGRALIDDADATAQIATLGLDADIATLSLPASTTISAFAKTVLDDADAAAARTTLGAAADTVVSAATLGTLGYAAVTANQTSIGGSVTDLTSLTVTVTVAAGRRIKVSGFANLFDAANGSVQLLIRESSTTLQNFQGGNGSGSNQAGCSPTVILTPSTGSHTYKLSAAVAGGNGTMYAASTAPAFILVEDIGT